MRLMPNRISLYLPLAMLLLVSACATQGNIQPPVDDIAAVTREKPMPMEDIATSQKAADEYSADIEAWGDRIHAAGGRLCRWFKDVYKTKVSCPK